MLRPNVASAEMMRRLAWWGLSGAAKGDSNNRFETQEETHGSKLCHGRGRPQDDQGRESPNDRFAIYRFARRVAAFFRAAKRAGCRRSRCGHRIRRLFDTRLPGDPGK